MCGSLFPFFLCLHDVDKEKITSIFNTVFLCISQINLILFSAFCSQFPFSRFLNFFLCLYTTTAAFCCILFLPCSLLPAVQGNIFVYSS